MSLIDAHEKEDRHDRHFSDLYSTNGEGPPRSAWERIFFDRELGRRDAARLAVSSWVNEDVQVTSLRCPRLPDVQLSAGEPALGNIKKKKDRLGFRTAPWEACSVGVGVGLGTTTDGNRLRNSDGFRSG